MPKSVILSAHHAGATSDQRERTALPYARPTLTPGPKPVRANYKQLHPEMLAHLKGTMQQNPHVLGPEVTFFAAAVAAEGRLDAPAVQQAQRDAYQGRLPTFGRNAEYETYLPNMFVRDAALFVAAGPVALQGSRQGMGGLLFLVQAQWGRTTEADKQAFLQQMPERDDLLTLFEFAEGHNVIFDKPQALYSYEVLVLPLMALFAHGGLPAVERGYFCISRYAYGPIASLEVPKIAKLVRRQVRATLPARPHAYVPIPPRPHMCVLPSPRPVHHSASSVCDVTRLEALALQTPTSPCDLDDMFPPDERDRSPGSGHLA